MLFIIVVPPVAVILRVSPTTFCNDLPMDYSASIPPYTPEGFLGVVILRSTWRSLSFVHPIAKMQSAKALLKNGLPDSSLVTLMWRTKKDSPGAAATDFHVNRSVANWMQDEMFNDFDELVASVKGWIASKTRQFFTRGIDKWEAIVETGGEYIPA